MAQKEQQTIKADRDADRLLLKHHSSKQVADEPGLVEYWLTLPTGRQHFSLLMQMPSLVDVASVRTKDIVDLSRGSKERNNTPLDRGFDVSGRNAPSRRAAYATHGTDISQGATIETIAPRLRSPHDQIMADVVAVTPPFLDGMGRSEGDTLTVPDQSGQQA